MHPNQIWGNDEKYSKEAQMMFRKRCEDQQKQWREQQVKHDQHVESLSEEQKIGYLSKWAEEQRAQGKIMNPFIEKWLEGEINTARTALVIGMLLTALIKGQVVIWVIMYLAYKGRVKRVMEEALEADRKGFKK